MYRYRRYAEIRYGFFREAVQNVEERNAVCRSRGWNEATILTPTVGSQGNIVIEETEYPSLDAFQKQTTAKLTDPEYMKVLRSSIEIVVQGSVRDELVESVTHIA